MIDSKQLALDLRLDDYNTFENFYIGNNQELINCLRTSSEHFVYISGPRHSGRSHLLQACCYEANTKKQLCFYLSLQNSNKLTPEILENLETTSLVCLDDIQSISAKPEWEEGIFKLFNNLLENKKKLIIAANVTPQLLPIMLQDLKSRLSSGLLLQITPLTDEQKIFALQMRAKKRGLVFSEAVGKYLLYRYARDTKSLFAILDKLDKAAFVLQHKITVPFIKEVLKKQK